jgi:hypothetical protein
MVASIRLLCGIVRIDHHRDEFQTSDLAQGAGVVVGVLVGGGVGEGGGIISGNVLVLPSTVALCPHNQQVTEPFLMTQ